MVGQAVWLKRPKTWKFWPKWIGPFEIMQRMGVNYKIRSQVGKISVVHHDHLKISQIPFRNGQVIPQTLNLAISRWCKMCQNAVILTMVKLLATFNQGLGKLACSKMFGRLFVTVSTKLSHPNA